MNVKTVSIPFRLASTRGDYGCADGELASVANATITSTTPPAAAPDTPGEATHDVIPAEEAARLLQLPPAPSVCFSLRACALSGWHNHPDNLPAITVQAGTRTLAGWGEKAMQTAVAFCRDAERSNLFTEPFLVLAAWRLDDGAVVSPSLPVLMTPNSSPFLVEGEENLDSDTMRLGVAAAVCSLRMNVLRADVTALRALGVTALEVYVSDPLPLFDRKGTPRAVRRVTDGNLTHSSLLDGECGERVVYDRTFGQGWRLPEASGDGGLRNLLALTSVRRVSQMPLSDLQSGKWGAVPFTEGNLTERLAFEEYTPRYARAQGVQCAFMSRFSGRLTMCGLTLTVPEVPVPATLAAHTDGTKHRAAVEVVSMKNGRRTVSLRSLAADPGWALDAATLPRWLFWPDPDAVSLRVVTGQGTFEFAMRPHPVLHGSWWWRGLEGGDPLSAGRVAYTPASLTDDAPDALRRDTYALPDAVWRSARESQRVWPDSLLMRMDTERVFAAVRAFRSSGLVATTAPTGYLFTAEGVYLVRESADGTLLDAGLMGSHRAGEVPDFRRDGTTLSFTASDGLRYAISGTRIVCLSGDGDGAASSASSADKVYVTVEGSGEVDAVITTRPLKMGDPEGRKRLRGVVMRGVAVPGATKVTVYGSDDLMQWETIARVPLGSAALMLSPARRFFKLRFIMPSGTPWSAEGCAVTLAGD